MLITLANIHSTCICVYMYIYINLSGIPILADNFSRYPELLSITSKQLYDFNANGQTQYLFDVEIIAILF